MQTDEGRQGAVPALPARRHHRRCAARTARWTASVFDRYRVPLYKQASFKPYIIAAMIFLAQVKDPARALMELDQGKEERKSF